MTTEAYDKMPKRDQVTIFMDDVAHQIHRGHQSVAEIKSACKVPTTDVIELIGLNGQLQLLDDNGAVTIKGGEKFISHKRGGGSS